VDAEGLEPPMPKGVAITARSPYPIWIDVQATRRLRPAGGAARQEGIEPSTTRVWKPLLCH
jgi:hypothetical protein